MLMPIFFTHQEILKFVLKSDELILPSLFDKTFYLLLRRKAFLFLISTWQLSKKTASAAGGKNGTLLFMTSPPLIKKIIHLMYPKGQ